MAQHLAANRNWLLALSLSLLPPIGIAQAQPPASQATLARLILSHGATPLAPPGSSAPAQGSSSVQGTSSATPTPGAPSTAGSLPGSPSTSPSPPAASQTPASPSAATTPSTPPLPSSADLPAFDLSRPEIRSFIQEASAQGLPARHVMALLSAAEPQPQIVDAMNRPAEKTLQWWEYRARMLTPARIQAGAQLWRAHKELLDQIALEYHVPAEYVIAVLGVETLYGRFTGHYRVIDALATLAFDYPPRANYFRHELTDFLLLAREQGLNPLAIRGSYAGAMGALQFMPSSYRKFAVSEQHAARSDLWTDWGDIFASTANFLHQAGWQEGGPVLADAQVDGAQTLQPAEHMRLTETLASLRAKGMKIGVELPASTPAMLLAAPEAEDQMHYRVGFQNFFVITRYNSSPFYAMAVCDLARAIRERIALEAAL
jgi:membrane-bound lytic murein transglycosylase B